MPTLDPRLDCMLKMTDTERQGARAAARRRLHLSGEPETTPAAPVTTRVFVRLTDAATARTGGLGIPGVTERSRLHDLLTAEATSEGLAALATHPDVLFVERAMPLLPTGTGESAGVKIDIPPGPLAETGKGVIVGIIDWGCDFTHGDFRDAQGRTRLLAFWDQSAEPGADRQPPRGYSTGVEFTADQINAVLDESDPFAALGVEPPGIGAHGTHVMGIAAGNGRADPRAAVCGLAPEADLIFVQPDTGDVNIVGGFGDSVHLAEAIKYIFDKAAVLRRSAVINLSMGTNSGPHDGSSLVEQWIDQLLGVPGRAVVLALGNEHHERFNRTHSEGRLTAGETTTLYWRTLPSDFSPNEVEIWYSGRDLFELEIELPDGRRLPGVKPGAATITQIPDSQTRVYQANVVNSPLNGDNQLNVIVVGPDAQPIEQGVWQLHVTARVAHEGGFDAWVERDSMQPPARQSSFIGGSYVRRKTLGSIQSARLAITVSNYDALTATLADSTSFGPTRDGRRAPTLAAPGTDIVAAKSLWRTDHQNPTPHVGKSGTSMSAPYVAGLVACMFQKNPRLTAAQVRSTLVAEAKPAPGFGDEWRIDWGNGRADPVDTLTATPVLAQPVSPVAVSRAVAALAADELAASNACPPTDDHVEGPFYRPGAPELTDLYPADSNGPVLFFEGTVSGLDCQPLPDVVLEVWNADDLGHYDNDDPAHLPAPDFFRCRGRLRTDVEGRYRLRTVLPANYRPVPDEPWIRVKHLHFKLFAPGYRPLTTEVALLPDEHAAGDILFNPRITADLEPVPEGAGDRQAFRSGFDFVLTGVSAAGYAQEAARITNIHN